MPIDIASIDTDGSIEQGDAVNSDPSLCPSDGSHVMAHALDGALRHPRSVAGHQEFAGPAPMCRLRPAMSVCGGVVAAPVPGDQLPRYPSVDRSGLYRSIVHARERVQADMDALPESVPVAVLGDGTAGARSQGLWNGVSPAHRWTKFTSRSGATPGLLASGEV